MLLVPRTKDHLSRTLTAVRKATRQKVIGLAVSTVTHSPTVVPFNCTGLVLTSAQAIPSLIYVPPELPTYCIGPTTAQAAEKKGLLVLHTEPDAAHLTAYIAQLHPQRFFHPKAENATPLNLPMHTVVNRIAYTTQYIPQLPAATLRTLRKTPPTGVLLFSPATAKTVARLFAQHNLPLPKTAYCLSPNVAEAWPDTPQKIAACPTLKDMLDLLA